MPFSNVLSNTSNDAPSLSIFFSLSNLFPTGCIDPIGAIGAIGCTASNDISPDFVVFVVFEFVDGLDTFEVMLFPSPLFTSLDAIIAPPTVTTIPTPIPLFIPLLIPCEDENKFAQSTDIVGSALDKCAPP